jgi:hypothetical protein
MSQMIEVKTADLIGSALDWAVAKADGKDATLWDVCCGNGVSNGNPNEPPECCCNPDIEVFVGLFGYSPSTDWSVGGPLISKHLLCFEVSHEDVILALVCDENGMFVRESFSTGETHLIAACRAIVAAKLGDVVSVPAELVGGEK